MAYVKRITSIKSVLTIHEYNILIGALTKNNVKVNNSFNNEIAKVTKEKFFKLGISYTRRHRNRDEIISK